MLDNLQPHTCVRLCDARTYLTVVDAERTLLNNQLALSQVKTNQMAASVHLIKALGGGWERL